MPWAFSAQALAKAHEDLELEKAGLLAVMRRVHTQERELGWFRSTQGRATEELKRSQARESALRKRLQVREPLSAAAELDSWLCALLQVWASSAALPTAACCTASVGNAPLGSVAVQRYGAAQELADDTAKDPRGANGRQAAC